MSVPECYDVVVATPYPNYDSFAHEMREVCGQWHLSLFIVGETWIKEFSEKLHAQEIAVRVLFDFAANQLDETDLYLNLAREVKRQGGHVIDDPDRTVAVANKARFHKRLLESDVLVPETVIVDRRDVSVFKITDAIKARIGVPFVVKPAWGYTGTGVIMDGYDEEALYRSAEEAPDSPAFLLQRRLTMETLGKHKGWFRLFYVCGTVIPCWWDPESHQYHMVKPSEIARYNLMPLLDIMQRIADISQMKKFSSEICLDTDGKFYAVDYINPPFDMNPQSFYDDGVPDQIVEHTTFLLCREALDIVKPRDQFFYTALHNAEENGG